MMARRKIRFVGQFTDPQVEMQMVEIVRVAQSLIDDVSVSQENILNINYELSNKETIEGATQKASAAETSAKEYTDAEIGKVKTYPPLGGPSANRPITPELYASYFDTDLGKPIWWNGAGWVDFGGDGV